MRVAAYRVPIPHTGCPVHAVFRCDFEAMYVFAEQEEHVLIDVLLSLLIFCPIAQVGWVVQAVVR